MSVRLEHANLSVENVDGMIAFVQTALPEFKIRGEGRTLQGWRWVHLGTDDAYLALNQAPEARAVPWVPYGGKPGTNHLGFAVEDVEALRQRLISAGYKESTVPNAHPFRRRVYFHDPEGGDWEFVEYLSDDPSECHDYSLPDL